MSILLLLLSWADVRMVVYSSAMEEFFLIDEFRFSKNCTLMLILRVVKRKINRHAKVKVFAARQARLSLPEDGFTYSCESTVALDPEGTHP